MGKERKRRFERMAKEQGERDRMADERKKPRDIRITESQLMQMYDTERAKAVEVDKRRQAIFAGINEIVMASDALNAIKDSKADEKSVLIPLGAGIYVDADIRDKKTAKANLAGGVVIDSRIEDVIKDLDDRKKELEKALKGLQDEMNKVAGNMDNLGRVITNARMKIAEKRKKEK